MFRRFLNRPNVRRESQMPVLQLRREFPLKNFDTEISPNDMMFDTSEHYVEVILSALKLLDYARNRGFSPASGPRTILDLPCGYGRVTRGLRSRFYDADITVCDIDRDAVDFCARKFNAKGVYGTEDFEGMEIGRSFDLIWVGSLVTHFSADQTIKFIRCMMRHFSANGLLIFTTLAGTSDLRFAALDKVRSGYRKNKLLRKDFITIIKDWRMKYGFISDMHKHLRAFGYGYTDDPRFPGTDYGHSLISRRWVENTLSRYAYIMADYMARGWDNYQDVIFVTR
jgi:SAM-dependent methyltransferase